MARKKSAGPPGDIRLDPLDVMTCEQPLDARGKELVKRGWSMGFTGVFTFKNARKAVQVAQWLPLERILIETDSPYMAPEPYRGRRNDSRTIAHVAAHIAALWQTDPDAVLTLTSANARRVFAIE